MNITYGITKEIYYLGINSRTSYGIAAYADTTDNGTAAVIASLHDITDDRDSLVELVLLCNRLELSLFHLNDVIEDFLAGCFLI